MTLVALKHHQRNETMLQHQFSEIAQQTKLRQHCKDSATSTPSHTQTGHTPHTYTHQQTRFLTIFSHNKPTYAP